jgi:hypothetical protein
VSAGDAESRRVLRIDTAFRAGELAARAGFTEIVALLGS